MKVTVEEIRRIHERQTEINREKLSDIEFYENGKKLQISQDVIDSFDFTGLLNTDFIISGYYKA